MPKKAKISDALASTTASQRRRLVSVPCHSKYMELFFVLSSILTGQTICQKYSWKLLGREWFLGMRCQGVWA